MDAKVIETDETPKVALNLTDRPSKMPEFKDLDFHDRHNMALEEMATISHTSELWGKFSNDSDAAGVVTKVHISRMTAIAAFYRDKLPKPRHIVRERGTQFIQETL